MARKKAANAFVWIILLLLIAGLAGFGLTNFGGSIRTVATVGDQEIEVEDYARALQAQMRRFQELTGQPMGFAQAQAIGLDQAALGQLVSEAALRNVVEEAGLSVGDENVSREITGNPDFAGASGEFDRETYLFVLDTNNVDVREFEERVRRDAAVAILRIAVLSGVETPDLFTDTLFAFAREERDVTWARLTADDLEQPLAEPTDAELRAFHRDNADLFTRGETRLIRYAWLTPDMLSDRIEVDDAQLRTLYETRIDEFVLPERRLVERLAFATEADAAAAMARIESGEATFDDLVAERGLTLDDVDLGDVTRADLEDAGDAIFAMDAPGVAGPLPSPVGPALYRMNAVLAAQDTSFEEAREDLAREAVADRARRSIADSIGDVQDLLAGGASVEDLAARTDMEAGAIEWRADLRDGIAAYEAFRNAAARIGVGDFPELVELADGGIAVIELAELKPPELIPFEEVRDEVIAAWERAETEAALTARAEALADDIRAGAEMAGLGLALETDRGLQRTAFVEGTPPDFIGVVFDMKPDDVRVLSADGSAWIVRLDAVRAPDPDEPEAQRVRAQFARETAQEISQSLLQAFTQSILAETPVTVNSQALNAVHAQMQ